MMKLSNIYISIFWSSVGFIFGKGGVLLTISLVSMVLSLEDFARFNLLLLVVNVFAGVIGLSMSLTANRYAVERNDIASILLLTIFISILSLVVFFLSEKLYFNLSVDIIELYLSCFIILFATYSNSLTGFMYAAGDFKVYAKVYAIQGFIMVMACFWMGKLYHLKGVLLGLLISYIVTAVYSVFFFKKSCIVLKINKSLIVRSTSKVLFPSILSGLFFQPAILITAFLINEYSSDAGVIAYSVANQFRMALGMLPTIMSSILLKLLVDNEKKYDKNVERVNYSFSYYPVMLISAVVLLFNHVITYFIDNLDADKFKICLIFFIAGTVVTSFKGAVSRKFVSREKGKISIISNFTWFICFLLTSYILVPRFGAKGAAFSFLFAQIVHLLGWTPFYIKYEFYYMKFFDLKFFISIPVYILLLMSVRLDNFSTSSVLFLIIFYFLIQEVILLKKAQHDTEN